MRRFTGRLLVLVALLIPLSAFIAMRGTHAQAGLTIPMVPTGAANSGLSGTVTVTPTGGASAKVDISVKGLPPNSQHAAHIHSPGTQAGACDTGGPVVYPLTDLSVDASGTGTSSTTVTLDPTKGIPTRGWYFNVHQMSTAAGTGAGIICAPITAALVASAGGAQASPVAGARAGTPVAGSAPSALPSNGGAAPSAPFLALVALAGLLIAGTGLVIVRHGA